VKTSRSTQAIHRAFVEWALVLGLFVALRVVVALTSTAFRGSPVRLGILLGLDGAVVTAAFGMCMAYLGVRRALFQREQAIAAASITSSDWLWESDAAGRLTYSSDGVRALLGHEPADVVGRPTRELLAPQARDEADGLLSRSIELHAGVDPVELPWLHADGHVVVLQGAAAPILDERGAVTGFRGTRRRLTDAMVGERELAAARHRVTALLNERQLTVALQPIADLTSGRIAGVEALTRFADGRPPDLWFRDAAETGLGLALDRLAFDHALTAFPRIPGRCFLSVNATPELLNDPTFHEDLMSRGLPYDRLVIEITEHERVSSYEDLALALTPLRERGVRLAVDDTGAGYASLNHVLQLRPDIIKLDRSLVSHVPIDPARRALVTALVLLALELGSSVTAEGIETPLELSTLANLGVDHAQGYLLSAPTTKSADWDRWWDRQWLTGETLAVDVRPERKDPRSARR
jgi:PAS domain S-box-containing protein